MKKAVIAAIVLASLYFGVLIGLSFTFFNHKAEVKATAAVATPFVKVVPPDAYGIWQGVNAERAKAGISQLVMNQALNDSAMQKCKDMVANDYWSHVDPSGQRAWPEIEQHYGEFHYAGENLAYGYPGNYSTILGWMNSDTHRANILNSAYTETGVAVCWGKNYQGKSSQYITVQHFAAR